MIYAILAGIAAVLVLIVVILIKSIGQVKSELHEKKLIIIAIEADKIRLQASLEDIETIRRKAKSERKKINAADNSDVANILNDMLSKSADTGAGS